MAMVMRRFECCACKHKWNEPYGTGRPESCPSCGGSKIHRAAEDKAWRYAWTGSRKTGGQSI